MSNYALLWAFSKEVRDRLAEIPQRNGSRAQTKFILVRLADCAAEDGIAFASLDSLSRDCEMSRQGVLNALERLESLHLVSKEVRGGLGGRGRRATRFKVGLVNGTAQSLPDRLWDRAKGEPKVYPEGPQSPPGGPDPSSDPSALRNKTRAREDMKRVTSDEPDGLPRGYSQEYHKGKPVPTGWHLKDK